MPAEFVRGAVFLADLGGGKRPWIVNDDDPHDDSVLVGTTDHTGRLVADMLLDAAPFATDMADMGD